MRARNSQHSPGLPRRRRSHAFCIHYQRRIKDSLLSRFLRRNYGTYFIVFFLIIYFSITHNNLHFRTKRRRWFSRSAKRSKWLIRWRWEIRPWKAPTIPFNHLKSVLNHPTRYLSRLRLQPTKSRYQTMPKTDQTRSTEDLIRWLRSSWTDISWKWHLFRCRYPTKTSKRPETAMFKRVQGRRLERRQSLWRKNYEKSWFNR